jgi:hypothetical protein
LAAAERFPLFSLIAKKHDKTIEQNNQGKEKKKPEETKATFFVMSPDVLFLIVFIVFCFNVPCYETPQNAITNSITI